MASPHSTTESASFAEFRFQADVSLLPTAVSRSMFVLEPNALVLSTKKNLRLLHTSISADAQQGRSLRFGSRKVSVFNCVSWDDSQMLPSLEAFARGWQTYLAPKPVFSLLSSGRESGQDDQRLRPCGCCTLAR